MLCACAVIEKLKEHGVDTVFGYPGANIAPIYNELSESGIKHILSGNEQFSAMEAVGYGEATGKTGVCFVTSGPGASNVISGIANAWADSLPLIVFSGQVPLDKIGTDAFQEADITGAAAPFCKYSYLVSDASKIKRYIDEAFLIASTGRPGPVLIDMPLDVQMADVKVFDEEIKLPGYKYSFAPDRDKLMHAAEMLNVSKRPLMLVGGGAKNAEHLIEKIGEKGIPVVTTMRGRNYVKKACYSLGMAGIYGTDAANRAMAESDCVLMVGARATDRTILQPVKSVIHIDIDKAELSKNLASFDILSDAKEALAILEPVIEKRALYVCRSDEKRLNLFSKTSMCAAEYNALYSVDVGQNLIFSLRGLEGKKVMASCGIGAMGFSVPAAIGAAVSGQTAFAFTGDGGFNMSASELFVIAANKLNVKIVVMNNSGLGMIHELQKRSYGENYCATSLSGMPSLKAVASAYGFGYDYVGTPNEIKSAIENSVHRDGGFIIEVEADIEESAY